MFQKILIVAVIGILSCIPVTGQLNSWHLVKAASEGQIEKVRTLLERGTPINKKKLVIRKKLK